jgi:hypothetical protein
MSWSKIVDNGGNATSDGSDNNSYPSPGWSVVVPLHTLTSIVAWSCARPFQIVSRLYSCKAVVNLLAAFNCGMPSLKRMD